MGPQCKSKSGSARGTIFGDLEMARNHTRESKKLKEADKGPGARGQESLKERAGGTGLEAEATNVREIPCM